MAKRNIGVTGSIARAYNATKHAEQISKFYNKEDDMAGQATRENEQKQHPGAISEANLVRQSNFGFLLKATQEFMEASKQEMGVFLNEDGAKVRAVHDQDPAIVIGHDLRRLRRRMLADVDEGEVTEYIDAEFNNDIVEMVDGLLDIIVIAWGTLLTYVGPEVAIECAAEVARSNLDKIVIDEVGSETVLKREDGKVMKPEGWVGPRILEILEEHNVFIPESTDDVLKMVRQEVEKSNGA